MSGPARPPRAVARLLLAASALALALAMATTIAPSAYAADEPTVSFSSTATGATGLDIHFSATSSVAPLAWAWDFGDGTTGSTRTPNHAYASVGTFAVALTADYAEHPPVTVTNASVGVAGRRTPAIPPAALHAVALVTGTGHVANRPVAFIDASTGSPTGRSWTFGDGGSSALARPSHTYAVKGVYTVVLIARNLAGINVALVKVSVIAAWNGGTQLYRSGAFSTQATWTWCVAASTQIIRNIVTGQNDHSAAAQHAYFVYGRAHNGYPTPESDGIDPGGWQAMLRAFVDPGYHIVSGSTYTAAVQAAARAMRMTGRPVGVFVGNGAHVWVISGFTATADPAVTTNYTVTSVNVEGPLWGRQSINGYDPPPNTRLSTARFRSFLTPYRDPWEPQAWRNRYVIVAP